MRAAFVLHLNISSFLGDATAKRWCDSTVCSAFFVEMIRGCMEMPLSLLIRLLISLS